MGFYYDRAMAAFEVMTPEEQAWQIAHGWDGWLRKQADADEAEVGYPVEIGLESPALFEHPGE